MIGFLRAAGVAALLAASAPAWAQAIGGNATLSATGTSSNVALPAAVASYPAVSIKYALGATQEVFYALGGSSVAAVATAGATQSPALPSNGICLNVGPNTYVAAITATSTATVRITQLTNCPNF